jgi:hypothetical protein
MIFRPNLTFIEFKRDTLSLKQSLLIYSIKGCIYQKSMKRSWIVCRNLFKQGLIVVFARSIQKIRTMEKSVNVDDKNFFG